MTDQSDSPKPRTQFKRAAASLLEEDENISLLEIASRVPFSLLDADDQYASWHASKPLEPMVRTLFLKELSNRSFKSTAELLDKGDTAEKLGFHERNPPSRTALSRTWNNRFTDDLRFYIENNASWIRGYACEIGHQLRAELWTDEERGTSKRTQQRVIDEKLQEVPGEVANLVDTELDFLPERASNAQYSHRAFIEAESTLGIERQAAETGCKNYGDYTNRDSGGPDADTLLHYVKLLSKNDIIWMFHKATGLLINQAKQSLNFERPVTAAIDITYIGYWGEKRGGFVLPSLPSHDYEWCHKFASLSIVGQNTKFFLALRPVHQDDSLGELVERLLSDATEHVSIRTVYADSEFAQGDVLREIEEYGAKYVIPVPKNARVKADIEQMTAEIEVEEDYGFYTSTFEGGSKRRFETTRVLLPSTSNPSKTVVFYTNNEFSDTAEAQRVVNRYGARWGIENAYKSVKTFLPWTTSNNHRIRLFHFVFSALLYNMWRLVDFLVKESIPREFTHDAVVRAKRFVGRMRVVYSS